MDSTSTGEFVVLVLIDCESSTIIVEEREEGEEILQENERDNAGEEILISTAEIGDWNLTLILSSRNVRIQANRDRLIQQSSYFRGLLGGSFSESSCNLVPIQWKWEAVIRVLQFIFGCPLDIAADNFLMILEGALFFGVETLLLECERWFHRGTSARGTGTFRMSLDALIEIWNFGSEHEIGFIPKICKGCLARNFVWAVSCSSFSNVPYDFLSSSIEDPNLTIDSEKQFCEALLVWLANNRNSRQCSSRDFRDCYPDILKKVRNHLVPLDYMAEKRGNPFFSNLADESISSFFHRIKDASTILPLEIRDDEFESSRIRLTEYSERIDLSGCVHISTVFLLLSLLPSTSNTDILLRKRVKNFLMEIREDRFSISQDYLGMLNFGAVHEVDISKCPKLYLDDFVKCFYMSFPSLRILKASHFLDFKMSTLFNLIQNFPLVDEVDLTVDISPVIATRVTIISSCTERYHDLGDGSYTMFKERPLLTTISKLTLEGRTDINDSDLLAVSTISGSLSHLNLKGCSSVTDVGISKLICMCKNLCSLVASDTCFGRDSILGLCEFAFSHGFAGLHEEHKHSSTIAFRLQQLHISGCKYVDQTSFARLLSHTCMLKSLSLKETSLVDEALFVFTGSSLENLDVSDTMDIEVLPMGINQCLQEIGGEACVAALISGTALACIIRRNPGLKFLKAKGCRNLHLCGSDLKRGTCPPKALPYVGRYESYDKEELYHRLSRKCILQEIAFGWGFSLFSLEMLRPSIRTLRSITVGLGASLGESALSMLPEMCPLLETVALHFQVISDSALRSIMGSLRNLRVLRLCCCLGDITSASFQISMPNLRTLRLERVTPWMTNGDLAILAKNCSSLLELSLLGCKLLDSDSQQIISSGWPGLRSIHLEECGKVTSNGVCALLDCKAVDDLLLRHNGRGIERNFIANAASKLPLVRTIALDLCDASEGGFDTPNVSYKDPCPIGWHYMVIQMRNAECLWLKIHNFLWEYHACKIPTAHHRGHIVHEDRRPQLKSEIVGGS